MPDRPCRFQVVGADPSFRAVVTVKLELLGAGVHGQFCPQWSAFSPAALQANDTVIGHVAGPEDCEGFRQFVQRLRQDGVSVPRIILVTDQLDMAGEIEFLKMGVSECLVRPLNLRRFSYLLQSIVVKSKYILGGSKLAEARDQDLHSRIAKLAGVSANVLITGETGVGKSYYAKEMHARSSRAKHPFVIVNCGAIPEHLFESELFGHERGAFTGAERKHVGKLEFAGEGTVFLDDVDALPAAIQPKLLHAVENREFYPLGSNQTVKFTARLVSATNRNLEALVSQGAFRSDLMYRLNAYELPIAALRQRTHEISVFAEQFARQFAVENQCAVPSISPDALAALTDYNWPGNVRELRNAVQFGAIDSEDGVIRLENLPERIRLASRAGDATQQWLELASDYSVVKSLPFLDEVRQLIAALVRHDFNRTEAAAALGYSRTTLYHKLEKLRLT